MRDLEGTAVHTKQEFVYHYCFRGVKDGIETYNNGFIDLPCKPATASESQELREYLLKNFMALLT